MSVWYIISLCYPTFIISSQNNCNKLVNCQFSLTHIRLHPLFFAHFDKSPIYGGGLGILHMEKISIRYLLVGLIGILLWLLFVGQANGISAIRGDINFIDEGQYAAWISDMHSGKTIYKDTYVQYSPLQVYPPYILTSIFGESIFYIRLWNTTITSFLGFVVLLALLKSLKTHWFVGILSIILLILLPGISIRYWLPILTFIFAVNAKKKQSKKMALVLGISLAITFLQSIEVGVITGILILFYLAIDLLQKRKFALVAWSGAGFFFVFFLFAMLALSQEWFVSYIRTSLDFIASASGIGLPNGQGLPNLLIHELPRSPLPILKFFFSQQMLFYQSLFVLVLFLSITIIRNLLRIADDRDVIIFFVLMYSILLFGVIVGRSGHYFSLLPMVITCSSHFLSLAITASYKHGRRKELLFTYFCIGIFILYGVRHILIFRYTDFFRNRTAEKVTSLPEVSPITISDEQAAIIIQLQKYIQKHSQLNDAVYIFNNQPAWYFFLKRKNPTMYNLPMTAVTKKQRLDIVASLHNNSPKFIIEDENAWPIDGISDRRRMPEIYAYIAKNYSVKEKVGNFLIYSKK